MITGGAAGIGKGTAKIFLREGAKVPVVDIVQKALEETEQEFNHAHVDPWIAVVSKVVDVRRYVQVALKRFGKSMYFSALREFRDRGLHYVRPCASAAIPYTVGCI